MKVQIYRAIIETLILFAILLYTVVHYRHFIQIDKVDEMELMMKAHEERTKVILQDAREAWMMADYGMRETNRFIYGPEPKEPKNVRIKGAKKKIRNSKKGKRSGP